MEKITITLYHFEQLPVDAQKQAIEKLRNINVDYDFWYAYSFDHFTKLCGLMGVRVEPGSIHFRGFYAQGDGSSFRADADLLKLIEAVKSRAWEAMFNPFELDIKTPDVSRRLLSLITKNLVNVSLQINAPGRGTHILTSLDWNYDSPKNLPHINKAFLSLENWFSQTAETLNNYLYRSLQSEYEFLTSDQSVKDTILANEYLFTSGGIPAFELQALAVV